MEEWLRQQIQSGETVSVTARFGNGRGSLTGGVLGHDAVGVVLQTPAGTMMVPWTSVDYAEVEVG